MGSGSSKSKSQKPAPKKPVANVNKDKDESIERKEPHEIKHPPPSNNTSMHDNVAVLPKIESTNNGGKHVESDYARKGNEDYNNVRKENEKNNGKSDKKKMKEQESKKNKNERHGSGLVFEDDSDMDNDIDEVLRIPMAIEYPQSKKDKKKNDRRERNSLKDDNDNINNNNERDSSVGRRDENLPETYAQRLQRQQYKLQQNMLIRQKTLYRNPNDWDCASDEKEEQDYTPQGFDASVFREANRRSDGRKELFTTNDHDELMTPRYMMQSGQNLDEVQINRRTDSPDRKEVPSYNQSELDLMAEIERDLL